MLRTDIVQFLQCALLGLRDEEEDHAEGHNVETASNTNQ